MMKYLYVRYIDLPQVEFFYELDIEGYALRQIELEDDSESVDLSCLGDGLSEGKVLESLKIDLQSRGYTIKESLENCEAQLKKIGVAFIDKESFEKEWTKYTEPFRSGWESLKNKVHIGDEIKATVVCFYPQGTIVNYEGWLSLHTIEYNGNIGEKISGTIVDFDETNMWLILE